MVDAAAAVVITAALDKAATAGHPRAVFWHQAGLAAMIDEDDAMEAEPRRDDKRVRRATLGEAQVSLAISGLGS